MANAIIFEPGPPCGDCNGDGDITISETARCVELALGSGSPETCPGCDVDGDGEVTQEDIDLLTAPVIIDPVTCPPVLIDVGSAGRDLNDKATIPVDFSAGRFAIGGVQNDIVFDNTVLSLPSVARCHINPAIGAQDPECQNDPNEVTAPCKDIVASLDQCGGAPQPDGCPDGAGTNLTRVRLLIAALSAPVFNPIPDGVLYECEFDVLDTNALPAALTITEITVSKPRGGQIFDVKGSGGEVTAETPPTPAGPSETPTPEPPTATPTLSRTPTLTQTGTPPPTPAGYQIVVGSAGANGEGEALIPISLVVGSAGVVGGTQNDILFDNTIVEIATCRINFDIDFTRTECELDPEEVTLPCKTLSRTVRQCGTNPQPTGCPPSAGSNLSRLRAIIAPSVVQTTNPIPAGLLYTCTFRVLDAERLPAALVAGNPVVSTPFGMKLFPVSAVSGAVTDEVPVPTPTHSATPSASPTTTPSATHTRTATPPSTPTQTPSASPSATPSQVETPTAAHSPTPTATTAVPACAGDCDASNSVTVDEITHLVTLALGNGQTSECPAGDVDQSETITVDELLTAVTNALNGCPVV